MSLLLQICEMIREVASYLPPRDISSFSRTSSHLYQSSVDVLFAELYITHGVILVGDSAALIAKLPHVGRYVKAITLDGVDLRAPFGAILLSHLTSLQSVRFFDCAPPTVFGPLPRLPSVSTLEVLDVTGHPKFKLQKLTIMAFPNARIITFSYRPSLRARSSWHRESLAIDGSRADANEPGRILSLHINVAHPRLRRAFDVVIQVKGRPGYQYNSVTHCQDQESQNQRDKGMAASTQEATYAWISAVTARYYLGTRYANANLTSLDI
ncbi:hypothetical protein C8J56DRAFT_879674 [Mycena floridula]|nr:hypothetical protein C8J56DRAFT_879674 [Mycena floridula]